MRVVAIILAAGLIASPAWAHSLKLATWNIEHLRDTNGEGPNPRDQADFDRLKGYAEVLDADVIAFQEVENQAAAERVFDSSKYQIFVENRNSPQRTGFAVRRGLSVTQNPDFSALNVTGGLRRGVDITITVDRTDIRLLSIHLKSGCFAQPLGHNSDACQKLNQQVPVLEQWIDARAAEQVPFIIMGDWNRRFDAAGDEFWIEIDDGKPRNADLARVTQGESPLCWDRQFALFIDHIVLDRSSSLWVDPYTFEQIVYQEDASLKDKLSDHCPIAVTLEVE